MSASAARMTWVMAVGFLLCVSGVSFAQDADSGSREPVANEAMPVAEMAQEPAAGLTAEVASSVPSVEPAAAASKGAMAPQWIWGEVVSVDPANNQVSIKHLDYDTYEEVTKVIHTDSGTLYENVSGIAELQAGDSVTVDFKIKDGAQMAELIVVDKNRTAAVEPSATPKPDQVSVATPEGGAVPAIAQEPVVPPASQASSVEPLVPAEGGGMGVPQDLGQGGKGPEAPAGSATGGSAPDRPI